MMHVAADAGAAQDGFRGIDPRTGHPIGPILPVDDAASVSAAVERAEAAFETDRATAPEVHGGPYPATTDGRSASVGTLAIDRFLRPVCYQNLPHALLPPELADTNPLALTRRIDGVLQHPGASRS